MIKHQKPHFTHRNSWLTRLEDGDFQITVANRDYHHVSQSEVVMIRGFFDIYLVSGRNNFRIVDNPGVNPVRSDVLRQSQDNFFRSSRTVDLSQAYAASLCILVTSFGSELHDTTQHGPDHKSRNCDGADRHEIDSSEPNHLSRTRIHHSQPFSGVLPRNTL